MAFLLTWDPLSLVCGWDVCVVESFFPPFYHPSFFTASVGYWVLSFHPSLSSVRLSVCLSVGRSIHLPISSAFFWLRSLSLLAYSLSLHVSPCLSLSVLSPPFFPMDDGFRAAILVLCGTKHGAVSDMVTLLTILTFICRFLFFPPTPFHSSIAK